MTFANELVYFMALAIAIMLISKGSWNLAKVFFGMVPAPSGLREAIAA